MGRAGGAKWTKRWRARGPHTHFRTHRNAHSFPVLLGLRFGHSHSAITFFFQKNARPFTSVQITYRIQRFCRYDAECGGLTDTLVLVVQIEQRKKKLRWEFAITIIVHYPTPFCVPFWWLDKGAFVCAAFATAAARRCAMMKAEGSEGRCLYIIPIL